MKEFMGKFLQCVGSRVAQFVPRPYSETVQGSVPTNLFNMNFSTSAIVVHSVPMVCQNILYSVIYLCDYGRSHGLRLVGAHPVMYSGGNGSLSTALVRLISQTGSSPTSGKPWK